MMDQAGRVSSRVREMERGLQSGGDETGVRFRNRLTARRDELLRPLHDGAASERISSISGEDM